ILFPHNIGHFGAKWDTIGASVPGPPCRGPPLPHSENGTPMSNDNAPPFLTSLAHHAADPFRLLVESVVDYAIYMVDPAGNVASWNPGAARIYGYRAEDIIGRPIARFYRPEDVTDGVPERVMQCVLEAGHFEQECWRVRRDGSQFWAVLTVAKLKD